MHSERGCGYSSVVSGLTVMQNLFTGTIVKAANLIAIVLGAYAFVHGEPSAKKIISPMVEIAVFIDGY
jgi:hypothetical protein